MVLLRSLRSLTLEEKQPTGDVMLHEDPPYGRELYSMTRWTRPSPLGFQVTEQLLRGKRHGSGVPKAMLVSQMH